jgi:predicted TIM-barrel fold metal-dependent hydrolase
MNRREFLATAGGVAASATLPAKDPPAMIPVIDTHQHLWDLSTLRLNWLKKGDPLDASFTPREYAEAIHGLNVVKSVYMEVDVVPEQQQQEADFIVALCESRKSPTIAAVISGRPNSDGFTRYITPYKGHRFVKGVRQVLHVKETTPEYYLDPKFVKGIQLLGELGLSFDLCIRPAELPEITKLVDRCPGTRFILDHCGNPSASFTAGQWDEWRKNMIGLAKRTNVVCKVSGFIANGWQKGKWKSDDLAPAVIGTIDAFGWERVMFGGDWPVCTLAASYGEWLAALRQIIADRPVENQKKLLHENAARYYGI